VRHKKIYHNIMREYEAARGQSEAALAKRKTNAYESFPRLAELDKNLGALGVKLARLALTGDEAAMLMARKESVRLREERLALLAKKDLDEVLSPCYRCKSCLDTGYIHTSPASPATMCACLKQRLIDEYYNLSNMNAVLRDENFDTFDIRLFSTKTDPSEGLSPRKNMEEISRVANSFVQNFGKKFTNLLLYGETGLGKTFICHCIAKDLLDRGFTVLYLTAPRLCKFIEDYRFNRESLTEPEEMLAAVDDADLLIIDDLGTEISTVITSVALFDIINQRLISRKSTIISTNLTTVALEANYSERIYSRFLGCYEIFKFFGNDIRRKKRYGDLRI